MRQSGVYEIVNIANRRSYIGSSIDISTRLMDHLRSLRAGRHRNSWLQADWLQYGESMFTFRVIIEAPSNELAALEELHIARAGQTAYNMARSVHRLSFSSLLKRSHTLTGKRWTPAQRAAAYNDDGTHKLTGRPLDEARKAQLRRRRFTTEWRQKISRAKKGRQLSDKHPRTPSYGMLGKKQSPQHKQRIRTSLKITFAARRALLDQGGERAIGLTVRCRSRAERDALMDWLRMNGDTVAPMQVTDGLGGPVATVGKW